ncbi:hypothetical protein WICPIJ_004382 [Wickerhamomyces pijperi]|uniref:Ribonucleases P/MRP subunit Pop8-like domain-containing protein n=1 Tax=Wickerhamomyces pijperi TaxID=599730 RepID=A0A9P8Q5Y2_WICPI|nr:hypothetical protein WICPIJ_004382 [Wickerhamomyces pijperi]
MTNSLSKYSFLDSLRLIMSPIDPKFSKSYKLKLRITPSVQEHLSKCTNGNQQPLTIDSITWHTLILRSLGKQHGLIGKAVQFDLLLDTEEKVSVFVSIHENDAMMFESAILSMGAVNLQELCGFYILDTTAVTKDPVYAAVDYETVSQSAMSKLKAKNFQKR